jgi:hypothetical protein
MIHDMFFIVDLLAYLGGCWPVSELTGWFLQYEVAGSVVDGVLVAS